jgi:hypothetical protein
MWIENGIVYLDFIRWIFLPSGEPWYITYMAPAPTIEKLVYHPDTEAMLLPDILINGKFLMFVDKKSKNIWEVTSHVTGGIHLITIDK